MMTYQTIAAVALGIGLSASAGFRIFIPLLVASLANMFGVLPLGESFAWMGSLPAVICFAVATVIEILAYYVPFIDNLLDTIATPLSVVAGTLLMTSVFPADSEWMKWLAGLVVGGGSAATVQGSTAITRLLSSKFTVGTGNPVVSTGENVAATGFSVMSLFFPILVASFVIIFIIIIIYFFKNKILKNKDKDENSDMNEFRQ